MLFRLIKYVLGYVEVALWGYAPERFFNLCSNHEILLWDLHQQDGIYYFKVSIRGFRMLKPLLQKSRTHVKILAKTGLPFFLFRYRKRKILFVSIFLCMAILFVLSRFIWKININGNDSVTNDSILNFLEECNSSYGTNISDIHCEKLEEELRSTFDNIIWTSIKREGTTLTVEVQENLVVAAETEESKNLGEFREQNSRGYDLTALHDGVVNSIYVRKGTPMVQAGEEVKKGTVLVSGALPIYDDSGNLTDYQYCTADADIELQTTYPYQEKFSMQHEERIYSGAYTKRWGIQLLNSYWKLPGKKIPYKEYSMTETRSQLRICDSFYLPVYFTTRTYEEYKTEQVIYSKKAAKTRARADLKEFLENLIQKGVLICEKNVMIKADENFCTAVGTITVQEHTFRYVPNQDNKSYIESETESE